MSHSLKPMHVQPALSTRWLGKSYHYFDTVGSTNDTLREMLSAGDQHQPPAGTVVLAEFQSRGRGRLDRRWLAPRGSCLLLSILFRPHWKPNQAQWLTMIASLAAADAIQAITHLTVSLKWPNDLVISVKGSWHKVSGLLLEGNVDADTRLQSAILGIGINVNIPAAELPETTSPVTSLMIEAGSPVSRLDLLANFFRRLEALYEEADRGGSPHHAWKQRLITLGQEVQVKRLGDLSPLTGMAEDADSWGQLLVRDGTGKLHQISAGDVTLSA